MWTRGVNVGPWRAAVLGFALACLHPAAAAALPTGAEAEALKADINQARTAVNSAKSGTAELFELVRRQLALEIQLYGSTSQKLLKNLDYLLNNIPYTKNKRALERIGFLEQILSIQENSGDDFDTNSDKTRYSLILAYDVNGQGSKSIPLLRRTVKNQKSNNSPTFVSNVFSLSLHLKRTGDIAGAIAALDDLPLGCLEAWTGDCAGAAHRMSLAIDANDIATVDRLAPSLFAALKNEKCNAGVAIELATYFEYKKNNKIGHKYISAMYDDPSCFASRHGFEYILINFYNDHARIESRLRSVLNSARSSLERAEAASNLGANLRGQDRPTDAAPFLRTAVNYYLKDHSSFAAINLSYNAKWLAEAYNGIGDHAHALAALNGALARADVLARTLDGAPPDYGLLLEKAKTLMALGRQAEAREVIVPLVAVIQIHPWMVTLDDSLFEAAAALQEAGDLSGARKAFVAFAERFGADPSIPRANRIIIRLQAAQALGADAATRTDGLAKVRAAISEIDALQLRLTAAAEGASTRQALLGDVAQSDYGRASAISLLLTLGWPEHNQSITLEAFAAAQDLEVSSAARALAQTAARTAAGGGALGEAARRQQELTRRLQVTDAALTTALSGDDTREVQRLQAEVASLGVQLGAADSELRKAFPRYAELASPVALPLAEVQKRLAPGEGLLLIVPVWKDIHAFAVSKTRVVWHRLEGGAGSVAMRVAALRCQVDGGTCAAAAGARRGEPSPNAAAGPDDAIPPYDLATAYSLYRDLIAPLEDALEGVDQLFVTANGPLSGLPLGLLPTSAPAAGADPGSSAALAGTRWLSDRYALTTLPSVSSLRAFYILRAPPGERPAFRGYGDPVLKGRAFTITQAEVHRGDDGASALANPEALRTGLAPLPHTREELSAMAQSLGAPLSSVRLGHAATETAVKTEPEIGAARVVAFATHGLIPTTLNHLEEPGLVMTPPQTATPEDDGYLSASEAAGLKLSADWLILSACNTAAASGKPEAESLSGLARAFLYAGAKALLASHWSVLDDATEALMIETLSAQRTDPKLTKAQALQRAMATVRTGHRADGTALAGWAPVWAHPAAWAPFVLIGAGE